MILDHINNSAQYIALHPGFKSAFDFLQQSDIETMKIGKYDIVKDKVFAIVAEELCRSEADAHLEAHNKHIDIQYVFRGKEEMGWRPVEDCLSPHTDYDSTKDLIFYTDSINSKFRVPQNSFAIFFPNDAHMPLLLTESSNDNAAKVKKVIIKVAI